MHEKSVIYAAESGGRRADSPVRRSPGSVLFSSSRDPSANLAYEELLLASGIPEGGLLLLYENDPAVVIGRYQNPWRECRTGLAERSGIPVLRRVSGGGTVVHGPGNLNFSVITAHPPDPAANLERVAGALGSLGVQVRSNSRHDLVVQADIDRKLSGSAFRRTSAASMHHGTLLVDADLVVLRSLIRQADRDMDARGVPSRPSPVANLSGVQPGLAVGDAVRALAEAWGSRDGPEIVDPLDSLEDDAFKAALRRLGTWEWNFGKTPAFTERFAGLAGYPEAVLELEVREGLIAEAPQDAAFLIGTDYSGSGVGAAAGAGAPEWLAFLARRIDGDPPQAD